MMFVSTERNKSIPFPAGVDANTPSARHLGPHNDHSVSYFKQAPTIINPSQVKKKVNKIKLLILIFKADTSHLSMFMNEAAEFFNTYLNQFGRFCTNLTRLIEYIIKCRFSRWTDR